MRVARLFGLCVASCLGSGIAQGQGVRTALVRGQVVDRGGWTVRGAHVALVLPDSGPAARGGLVDSVSADSLGRFVLRGPLQEGCYLVVARWIGYGPTERTFVMPAAGTMDVGFMPLYESGVPENPTRFLNGCAHPRAGLKGYGWGVDTVRVHGKVTTPDPGASDVFQRVIRNPDDPAVLYHRRIVAVAFPAQATGAEVNAYLMRFQASIAGGYPFTKTFLVLIPDPGHSWPTFDRFVQDMAQAPGVDSVTKVTRNERPDAMDSVPPRYGPGRPHIPIRPTPDDAAHVVNDPADPRFTYFRRLVSVMFTVQATDVQVQAFFARFKARVVGGVPATGEYLLQIPDPGRTYAALDRVLTEMERSPGVVFAAEVARLRPKAPVKGAP